MNNKNKQTIYNIITIYLCLLVITITNNLLVVPYRFNL